MPSLHLQPSAKTQKILTDEEFEAKLLARMRNRRSVGATTWPPEDDEKPVLIRSWQKQAPDAPLQTRRPTVYDVDANDTHEAVPEKVAPPVAVHLKRGKKTAVKRPRKEGGNAASHPKAS